MNSPGEVYGFSILMTNSDDDNIDSEASWGRTLKWSDAFICSGGLEPYKCGNGDENGPIAIYYYSLPNINAQTNAGAAVSSLYKFSALAENISVTAEENGANDGHDSVAGIRSAKISARVSFFKMDTYAAYSTLDSELETYRQEKFFSPASWSEYLAQLRMTALGCFDPRPASSVSAQGLSAAVRALVYNNGTATVNHYSVRNQSGLDDNLIESDTYSYNPGQTVQLVAKTLNGYTISTAAPSEYSTYSRPALWQRTAYENNTQLHSSQTASGNTLSAVLDTMAFIKGSTLNYSIYYNPNCYQVTYDPNGGVFNGTTDPTTGYVYVTYTMTTHSRLASSSLRAQTRHTPIPALPP